MFGMNFLVLYLIRKFRENRRRRNRRRKRDAKGLPLKKRGKDVDEVDGPESDEEEVSDIEVSDRPFISNLTMIWGFVEAFSLLLVLMQKAGKREQNDYYNNFLQAFCAGHQYKCEGIVFRIIYFKLFVSLLLVVGAKYRIMLLMLPWLIVNVLGIFPYFHVVFSAYGSFSDLKTKLDEMGENWAWMYPWSK